MVKSFSAASLLSAGLLLLDLSSAQSSWPPSPNDPQVRAALQALGHTQLQQPGSRPYPGLPAGTDTIPGIEHIVMLMLENHSYDNILGMLSRGDGFTLDSQGKPLATNPYANGSIQHAFQMPTTCQLPSRPSQEWLASHNAYNNGSMNGFVSTLISSTINETVGGVAMGYYTSDQLPFTYSLAEQFPIADRWHCSALTQTYPQRKYLIAGTSRGMTDDNGNMTNDYAPAGTIFNQLDQFNISWMNYAEKFEVGSNTPDDFGQNDLTTESEHRAHIPQFFTDAARGNLSAFSFIDPNYGTQSQENPQNVVVGEALLSDIVHAIGSSPKWNQTLFILTWDEHGGYYDHVPPPPALKPDDVPPNVMPGEYQYEGFARYGMRVPAVIVSPYSKPSYVSHTLYDHTSVLATLHRKWNLPSLTYRDANANDFLDMLDLAALAKGSPTFPALPHLAAPGNTTAALACSTNGPGVIPLPGSVTN